MDNDTEQKLELKKCVAMRNDAVFNFDLFKFKLYLHTYFTPAEVNGYCKLGDDFLTLTMAKMCKDITDAPQESLKKADEIINEYREKHKGEKHV